MDMIEIPSQSSPAERDSRTQILQAAGTVFLTEGLERASVDMVAAAAHMSKQSIYELFPSKLTLFEAAVRNKLDHTGLIMTAIEEGRSVEDTLTRYGLRLFEAFADPVNFGLFRANIAAANHFPELATELHERRLAASQRLADYLEKLLSQGLIVPCDPQAMAIRFGGLAVEGARYFLGRDLPGRDDRWEIVVNTARLFLNGYRGMTEAADDAIPPIPVEPPALEGGAALRLSAEKLSALVDIATAEFLDNGYRRASVDRIAAAAHVSKATIYRHFGCKENLLRYVVRRDIFETSRSGIEFAGDVSDADTAITALAERMLDLHLAPANIRMHRLLTEEAALIPDLAQLFHEVRVRRLSDPLERVLAMCGLPRSGEAAARTFYTLATFAVRFITSTTLPDAAHRKLYARESAMLFLHGLRADGD